MNNSFFSSPDDHNYMVGVLTLGGTCVLVGGLATLYCTCVALYKCINNCRNNEETEDQYQHIDSQQIPQNYI